MVCLDEMGPESAKQEVDYGRRGKGTIFGAFQPATGDAFTRPCFSRRTANGVAFLEEVERWLPSEVERVAREHLEAMVNSVPPSTVRKSLRRPGTTLFAGHRAVPEPR